MICSARFIIINMFLLVCTIHYRTFIVILDEIACFSYKNDSVVFCMYVFCLGNVVKDIRKLILKIMKISVYKLHWDAFF